MDVMMSLLGATRVAKDWRVVMVPENNNTVGIMGLFNGISSHTFDEEPFCL